MALNKKLLLVAGLGLVGLSGLTIACSNSGPNPAAQSTPAAQSSPVAQTQPSTQPSSLDRLRIVFPSRTGTTEVQRKADAIAKLISSELKMPVEAVVADDTAAVEALRADRAEVAFLSSRPALKAEKLAGAKLYLAEVRPDYSGGQTYRSVMVVRDDSELQKKSDSKENLEQLKGKKMSFTSPTSGSGFVFPVGELVKNGMVPDRDRLTGFFGQVSYGGNYSGALQAVLRGQADVAAVSEYALRPPYITEEEGKQLRILHEISGVPAHGVAIDDRVPEDLRGRVIAALQKLNEPANNALLSGLYNSNQLVKVDHATHLAPVKEALQKVGMEP
jgi:phosphonate transport system substrate-binding protein